MRRQIGARHDRLTVIVIYTVVAVPVHGPGQVFFQTVRMPVLGDHLRVLLKHVEDRGCMRGCWRYRPEEHGHAEKRRERGLSDCP